jgi:hypothetical protein
MKDFISKHTKDIVGIVFMLLCVVGFFVGKSLAAGSIQPTVKNKGSYVQVVFATMSDSEVVLFNFNGYIPRIVVTSTGNDADGTLTISDVSTVNCVSLAATTFSSCSTVPVDIAPESLSKNSNYYGAVRVGSECTLTLTNCADLGATTVTIYTDKIN